MHKRRVTTQFESFVEPDAIAPMYFAGKPYYMLPDGPAGEKPFGLLHEADTPQRKSKPTSDNPPIKITMARSDPSGRGCVTPGGAVPRLRALGRTSGYSHMRGRRVSNRRH